MATDWHYTRPGFSHDVFVTLTQGPLPALSLFGPRRTGKTEFLQRDLGFLAGETYKHRVLYASFWQTSADPLAVLLYACDLALQPRNHAQRMLDWAATLPIRFKLKALKGAAEVEIDLNRANRPDPARDLLLLDQLLDRLSNATRPTLLMLDEFQEVASHAQGHDIMAGLRTSLDRRKDGLRTVFTGSSQVGLNKVFTARDAPLYRFAAPLDLPPLDDEFVDHQLAVFHRVYRRTLERDQALAFFHRFQRNPMFFQRWIMTMGLHASLSPEDAAQMTASQLAADLELDRTWLSLSTGHRAMARIFAERVPEPFGASGARRYRELTGRDAPIPQTRQSYRRKLERDKIVDQWEKQWRIADPIFERWILDRTPQDF